MKNTSQSTAPLVAIIFNVLVSSALVFGWHNRLPCSMTSSVIASRQMVKISVIPQPQEESQNNYSESGHFLNLGPVVCLSRRSFCSFPCEWLDVCRSCLSPPFVLSSGPFLGQITSLSRSHLSRISQLCHFLPASLEKACVVPLWQIPHYYTDAVLASLP